MDYPDWLKARLVYDVVMGTMAASVMAPFGEYVSVSTFGPYDPGITPVTPYAMTEEEAWSGFWDSLKSLIGPAQMVVFRKRPTHIFVKAGEAGGKWGNSAPVDRHLVVARVAFGFYMGKWVDSLNVE